MLWSAEDTKDFDYDKKVKRFFRSCINLKNGFYPESVLKVLEEFGKMPALVKNDKEWNEYDFDWLDTLARIIEKYGFPIIIAVGVNIDFKDNSSNRLYIGQAEFELVSKSVYLEPMGEEYRRSYEWNIATDMEKLLKINLSEALPVAKRIVDFEAKLAKGFLDDKVDGKLDELLIKTNADELQQKYGPTIDVKRLLKIVLGKIPEGIIYEYFPGYLQNVKEIIEKAEKRDIANYLFYQLMRRFRIRESETTEELEKKCLTIVKKQFHKAIDNMFYRHFLDEQMKNEMQVLWHKIKSTFRTKLLKIDSIDWLTAETRAKALEKLEALQLSINSYEDYNFSKDFDNLTVLENDFVGNLQNITAFENRKWFRELNRPVRKYEAGAEISDTAVNILIENTIYVPVLMLQPYFLWAPNFPDFLTFSLMGFFFAHELIHSFDDTGRQFSQSGRMEEWWDAESTQRFLNRRNCFSDQYHGYVYGGKPLPRSVLQSENIADNGGLKLAYDAFIAHSESSNNVSLSLLDFQYTDKQLFFISYGQLWCTDVQDYLIDLFTAIDDHTPGEFRNIGTISNSLDFAEVFNCAVGSKMNPEKKCKMYR